MTLFGYLRELWENVRVDRADAINFDPRGEQQRQDIRDDAEAFERIWTDRRLDLYGKPWGGPWPADLCAYPPCEPEDGWQCPEHKPRGRHHRGATVTDITDWKDRVQ